MAEIPLDRIKRTIREDERQLLRDLARRDPEHHEEYLRQIDAFDLVEDWNDGTSSISFMELKNHEIRVEAISEDQDGVEISILLFGDGARLACLEIFRGDNLPLKRIRPRNSSKTYGIAEATRARRVGDSVLLDLD